jgi:hypothetical protein
MTDMDEVENIPAELKKRDQWLMWDAAHDTPRRPHWKGDFGISWSDPDDWHSFETAVSAAKTRDSWGIGYVMAKDNDDYARGLYGCLDLDGVHDDEAGEKKEWLPGLSTFFDGDGYLEYSPSETGIHIPLVGQDAPDWWSDSHFTADEHEGVEYLTNKFVTFTGDKLRGASDTVSDADPTPGSNRRLLMKAALMMILTANCPAPRSRPRLNILTLAAVTTSGAIFSTQSTIGMMDRPVSPSRNSGLGVRDGMTTHRITSITYGLTLNKARVSLSGR